MANNKNLHKANKAKNDEFYTQYKDIELEIEAYNKENFTGKTVYCCCDDVFTSNFAKYFINNFKRLELKELIVSGFSTTEKGTAYYFRTTDPAKYIEDGIFKTELIKTEVKEMKRDGIYDGGDFRSAMATELLKQSDIVITNPPFSLFREFIAWIMEADKKFIIIGNKNAITYKEFFPLLKDNKAWIGNYSPNEFLLPDGTITRQVQGLTRWFTNVDHGRRHQKLSLMTMEENLKYSKHKSLREQGYLKYDNYDAIEVPYTDAIPSDYEPCWFKCPQAKECTYAQTEGFTDEALCEKGFLKKKEHSLVSPLPIWTSTTPNNSLLLDSTDISQTILSMDTASHSTTEKCMPESSFKRKCNGIMGIPISFFDKFCPEQFKIIGATESEGKGFSNGLWNEASKTSQPLINGERKYKRLFVQKVSSERKCNGVMGVPISFFDKFCSEQFRIIGEANHGSDNSFDLFKPTINKREVFKRILIQKV